MAHRRHEPAAPKDTMERFFENGGRSVSASAQAWVPPVDMYETADDVVIRAELPGVEEKDVRIEMSENYITIQGKRPLKTGHGRYVCLERNYGSFQRTFRLPVIVEKDEVHAEYRFGVLMIVVKKQKGQSPEYVRVEIE
ncbi:MAG: Hsp20/alpha crystallin family protein [Nitrospinae bacterium]|nr:Hsp20/alpha crystallin family protein [Nitrospinota bacterium]